MKASEIASAVAGTIEGGADLEITGIAPLDRAGSSDLSFLSSARYAADAASTAAGVLLATRDLVDHLPPATTRIIVPNVYAALGGILPRLYPPAAHEPGVHATAVIGAGVVLGADVRIGAYAVIGDGTTIGARATIASHCVLGRDCVVQSEAYLHPHVTLYDRSRIGARTILHSGVRVGVDGFGYHNAGGINHKIPQVGTCVIGDDVEIGANTTIDRGSIGATEIGNGVKIDDQVHIGHNVRIGDHSIVIAQVGISGSTRVGKRVTLAGQAGVAGHIRIGDGATIAGRAAVFGDVPAGAIYSGYPARPHRQNMRSLAALQKLPELLRQLKGAARGGAGDKQDPES